MPVNEYKKLISKQLKELGVAKGDVIFVHSSLSSFGYVPGGERTIIESLYQAVGETGTLLFPSLSYEIVTPENPYFDVVRTPSNVGKIPEYFRKHIAVKRSLNPTHSVSGMGKLVKELLSDHSLDETPCGEHSPYRKLPERNGKILFLGCGIEPNTSMHAIEELVNPPYLFGNFYTYKVIDEHRRTHMLKCRRHDFNGWKQRYDRIEAILEEKQLHSGKVLKANAHLIEAKPLWDRALNILKKDPFYFVERV
ncbi:aminoglycoside 3-N-acetyltransferase [Bacillus niacini]|uniref:Aminoglycoside N(3)-acetyltransferase n=1 Tax=Neobacillus niacini TaxID=86668 RepID=A0A852TMX7_9BACI|nr:AAC(3) family N-acetyltransferase [Neobacillus niacini]NYE09006.1 aminoglycoside 3-N-acetyltransferase [Neobacillus niacini]